MTNEDIARAAGLARSTVAKISKRDSWTGTTIETIARFQSACGVSVFNMNKVRKFLRRKLSYLEKADGKQRRMYDRIIRELSDTRRDSNAPSHRTLAPGS